MVEAIRKEVEGNIGKINKSIGKIGEGIKKLAIKLFSMVLSFWLILIAFGSGVGVPVYVGKEVLGSQISKMTESVRKDLDPGGSQPQRSGMPQARMMNPVQETYSVQSVSYQRPVPLDRNIQQTGQSVTEVRRIMNALVSLKNK